MKSVRASSTATLSSTYYYYRPQRSWGMVIFSVACVKNSFHREGGLPLCMRGYTPQEQIPPGADPPQEQTPPPQEQTPPPQEQTPPQCSASSEIRATSGRYASYWNAYLLRERGAAKEDAFERYNGQTLKHNFYIYLEFLLFINLYSSDSSLASRISIHNLEGSLFKWANESRPMVDRMDQPTIFAHPYSAVWGKLLKPELRRSEHMNS